MKNWICAASALLLFYGMVSHRLQALEVFTSALFLLVIWLSANVLEEEFRNQDRDESP